MSTLQRWLLILGIPLVVFYALQPLVNPQTAFYAHNSINSWWVPGYSLFVKTPLSIGELFDPLMLFFIIITTVIILLLGARYPLTRILRIMILALALGCIVSTIFLYTILDYFGIGHFYHSDSVDVLSYLIWLTLAITCFIIYIFYSKTATRYGHTLYWAIMLIFYICQFSSSDPFPQWLDFVYLLFIYPITILILIAFIIQVIRGRKMPPERPDENQIAEC